MTFPRMMRRHIARVNGIGLWLAGHAAFADLEHRGRRTGAVRHTPVRAFRTGDTIVIGLNFGRESDWVKNIQAAGGCRMRLGRWLLDLGSPQIVPVQQGVKGMPWPFAIALRYLVRTVECVEMPILSTSPLSPRSGH